MLTFLKVTMDSCYKTFFYFAKHKDKRMKRTILGEKIAHMELSSENFSLAESTTCYTHIDWLLINSTANVVQSNFLSHNAVANISTK